EPVQIERYELGPAGVGVVAVEPIHGVALAGTDGDGALAARELDFVGSHRDPAVPGDQPEQRRLRTLDVNGVALVGQNDDGDLVPDHVDHRSALEVDGPPGHRP